MIDTEEWVPVRRAVWRELFVLIVLGALANIYFLANFSPSIDDELAAVRADRSIWISQGRFTIYLVETLLFPQPATSFGPYLFFIATLACGYMLMRRAHGISVSWRTYVGYWLFATYPTWFLIEEFSANVPSTGVGFLCVTIALHLFSAATTRRSAVAIVVLLAVAAGAYQSLLLLFLGGAFGIVICRSLKCDGPFDRRGAINQLAFVSLVLVGGAVLYFALNKSAMMVSGATPVYIDSFVNLENLSAPLWLTAAIVRKAAQTYAGATTIFGASIPAAAMTIIGGGVAIAVAKRRLVIHHAILFLALLAAPFLLNFLSGPDGLPLRSMVAVPYVIWVCAMVMFESQSKFVLYAGAGIFAVFSIQATNLTSQYMAAATVTQSQDRMMAHEVGRRLSDLRQEGDSTSPILLDVYGFTQRERPSVYASADTSTTRGSFFGWGRGDVKRVAAYLRVLGYDDVRPVADGVSSQLTGEYEQMPPWPQLGSIRRSGDYYLLKLGTMPDKARRSPGDLAPRVGRH